MEQVKSKYVFNYVIPLKREKYRIIINITI